LVDRSLEQYGATVGGEVKGGSGLLADIGERGGVGGDGTRKQEGGTRAED
jgi:hypothetical protein